MAGEAEPIDTGRNKSTARRPKRNRGLQEAGVRKPRGSREAARELRKQKRYPEAVAEYEKLIDSLRSYPHRSIELLKLRCKVGSCLLASLHMDQKSTAKDYDYAGTEAYLRETLADCHSVMSEDRDEGISITQNDLAQCLIRRAEYSAAQESKDEDRTAIENVREAIELYEHVLSYRMEHDRYNDASVESILRRLAVANHRLRADYRDVERFSRRELEKLEQIPTLYGEKATITLKRYLADALFDQGSYEEAKATYRNVIDMLQAQGENASNNDEFKRLEQLKEFQQFAEDCDKATTRRRWGRAYRFAREQVRQERLAAYRLALKEDDARKEEARLVSIRRKWKRIMITVRLIALLNEGCRERRKVKVKRNWQVSIHAILFPIRLRTLQRHVQARQRWWRATSCISLRTRANVSLNFFRQRKIRAQKRWNVALLYALGRAKLEIAIRHRRADMWYASFVRAKLRAKWFSLIECTLCALKLRRRLCRRRQVHKNWSLLYSVTRLIARLLPKRGVAGAIRTSSLPAPQEEDSSTPFVTPSLEFPDPWGGSLKPQILQPLFEEVQAVESTSEIFFGARDSPRHESLDQTDKDQADQWMYSYGSFCKQLATHSRPSHEIHPVKIAVIDTGIDVENAFVKSRWLYQGLAEETRSKIRTPDEVHSHQMKRIKKCYKDFLDPSPDQSPDQVSAPTDHDGHGTHISGLILRYAPNSHLYVARVARTRSSCKGDAKFERRVVDAISWALEVCDVDIISLSFALHSGVLKAQTDNLIDRANSQRGKRKKRTIMIAAACNEGGREPVPYPANHYLVFSVRALTGYGKDAEFSPYPTKYDPNFSVIGTRVLSTWPNHLQSTDSVEAHTSTGAMHRVIEGVECMTRYMDGTSFSAPLLAALVGNVFAFYIQHKPKIVPVSHQSHSYLYEVQNFSAVKKILLRMSIEYGDINVLSPWLKESFGTTVRQRSLDELITAIRWALES